MEKQVNGFTLNESNPFFDNQKVKKAKAQHDVWLHRNVILY